MSAIRVLVVDDHPLYRDGLRTMIEATDDLLLTAEAQDGEGALQALQDSEVDVALLDVNMPGLNGIDAARRIATEAPDPEIAAQLGLSRKTASNYVSAILTKLQVRDRAEAAERARRSMRPD